MKAFSHGLPSVEALTTPYYTTVTRAMSSTSDEGAVVAADYERACLEVCRRAQAWLPPFAAASDACTNAFALNETFSEVVLAWPTALRQSTLWEDRQKVVREVINPSRIQEATSCAEFLRRYGTSGTTIAEMRRGSVVPPSGYELLPPLSGGAEDDAPAVVPGSGASFFNAKDGLFLHVWQSPKCARRYSSRCQRAHQAIFEHRLQPLVVPVVMTFSSRGTVFSLSPIAPLRGRPADIESSAAESLTLCLSTLVGVAARQARERIVESVRCAANGTYVVTAVHLLGSDVEGLVNDYSGTLQATLRPEALSKICPDGLEGSGAALLGARDVILQQFAPVALDTIAQAVETAGGAAKFMECVQQQVVTNAFHGNGVNMAMLGRAHERLKALTNDGGTAAATAAMVKHADVVGELLETEMVCRVVKEILKGELRSNPQEDDGAALDRVNRFFAYVSTGNLRVWAQLVDLVRDKFNLPATFTVTHSQRLTKILLWYAHNKVGCVYDAPSQRFSRLIAVAPSTGFFVAPDAMKLASTNKGEQAIAACNALMAVASAIDGVKRPVERALRYVRATLIAYLTKGARIDVAMDALLGAIKALPPDNTQGRADPTTWARLTTVGFVADLGMQTDANAPSATNQHPSVATAIALHRACLEQLDARKYPANAEKPLACETGNQFLASYRRLSLGGQPNTDTAVNLVLHDTLLSRDVAGRIVVERANLQAPDSRGAAIDLRFTARFAKMIFNASTTGPITASRARVAGLAASALAESIRSLPLHATLSANFVSSYRTAIQSLFAFCLTETATAKRESAVPPAMSPLAHRSTTMLDLAVQVAERHFSLACQRLDPAGPAHEDAECVSTALRLIALSTLNSPACDQLTPAALKALVQVASFLNDTWPVAPGSSTQHWASSYWCKPDDVQLARDAVRSAACAGALAAALVSVHLAQKEWVTCGIAHCIIVPARTGSDATTSPATTWFPSHAKLNEACEAIDKVVARVSRVQHSLIDRILVSRSRSSADDTQDDTFREKWSKHPAITALRTARRLRSLTREAHAYAVGVFVMSDWRWTNGIIVPQLLDQESHVRGQIKKKDKSSRKTLSKQLEAHLGAAQLQIAEAAESAARQEILLAYGDEFSSVAADIMNHEEVTTRAAIQRQRDVGTELLSTVQVEMSQRHQTLAEEIEQSAELYFLCAFEDARTALFAEYAVIQRSVGALQALQAARAALNECEAEEHAARHKLIAEEATEDWLLIFEWHILVTEFAAYFDVCTQAACDLVEASEFYDRQPVELEEAASIGEAAVRQTGQDGVRCVLALNAACYGESLSLGVTMEESSARGDIAREQWEAFRDVASSDDALSLFVWAVVDQEMFDAMSLLFTEATSTAAATAFHRHEKRERSLLATRHQEERVLVLSAALCREEETARSQLSSQLMQQLADKLADGCAKYVLEKGVAKWETAVRRQVSAFEALHRLAEVPERIARQEAMTMTVYPARRAALEAFEELHRCHHEQSWLSATADSWQAFETQLRSQLVVAAGRSVANTIAAAFFAPAESDDDASSTAAFRPFLHVEQQELHERSTLLSECALSVFRHEFSAAGAWVRDCLWRACEDKVVNVFIAVSERLAANLKRKMILEGLSVQRTSLEFTEVPKLRSRIALECVRGRMELLEAESADMRRTLVGLHQQAGLAPVCLKLESLNRKDIVKQEFRERVAICEQQESALRKRYALEANRTKQHILKLASIIIGEQRGRDTMDAQRDKFMADTHKVFGLLLHSFGAEPNEALQSPSIRATHRRKALQEQAEDDARRFAEQRAADELAQRRIANLTVIEHPQVAMGADVIDGFESTAREAIAFDQQHAFTVLEIAAESSYLIAEAASLPAVHAAAKLSPRTTMAAKKGATTLQAEEFWSRKQLVSMWEKFQQLYVREHHELTTVVRGLKCNHNPSPCAPVPGGFVTSAMPVIAPLVWECLDELLRVQTKPRQQHPAAARSTPAATTISVSTSDGVNRQRSKSVAAPSAGGGPTRHATVRFASSSAGRPADSDDDDLSPIEALKKQRLRERAMAMEVARLQFQASRGSSLGDSAPGLQRQRAASVTGGVSHRRSSHAPSAASSSSHRRNRAAVFEARVEVLEDMKRLCVAFERSRSDLIFDEYERRKEVGAVFKVRRSELAAEEAARTAPLSAVQAASPLRKLQRSGAPSFASPSGGGMASPVGKGAAGKGLRPIDLLEVDESRRRFVVSAAEADNRLELLRQLVLLEQMAHTSSFHLVTSPRRLPPVDGSAHPPTPPAGEFELVSSPKRRQGAGAVPFYLDPRVIEFRRKQQQKADQTAAATGHPAPPLFGAKLDYSYGGSGPSPRQQVHGPLPAGSGGYSFGRSAAAAHVLPASSLTSEASSPHKRKKRHLAPLGAKWVSPLDAIDTSDVDPRGGGQLPPVDADAAPAAAAPSMATLDPPQQPEGGSSAADAPLATPN